MSKSLMQDLVDYLLYQKSLGRKNVYRTVIYGIFEYKYKWDAEGRMLSTKAMQDVASKVGAVYISDSGRARFVFN
jgi:hypothetical protein